MQHFDLFKIPKIVLKDQRLNLREFKLLVVLFSRIKQTEIGIKKEWHISIDEGNFNDNIVQSLLSKDWIEKKDNDYYLKVPEKFLKNIQIEEESITGTRIVKKWDQLFGTLNLTPTLFQKILSFMEDGITEDVIIEVMKISKEKTNGNPGNYIISILRDYLNRSIYTIYDFKEEKQRMEEYEKRLQEINRKKEERDEEESIEDFYKKGYR